MGGERGCVSSRHPDIFLRRSNVALCFAFLCLATIRISADKFCEAGTGTAPFTLSDYIKTAFSAELYVLVSHDNSASWLYEHYSVLAQKSAVYTSRPDADYMYYWIFDLQTKTGVADWDGQGCVAVTSDQPVGLTEFDTEQATYVGTETVNGETLHLWRQCDTNSFNEVISLELYTTGKTEDWSNPQGQDYQPVMLRRKQQVTSDLIDQITYFVLYYSIRDDDDSLASDLEPPLGAICPIQAEVNPPGLPSTMIYSQELVADPRHPETFMLDTERLDTIIDRAGPSVLDSQREIDSYEQAIVYLMPNYDGSPCGIISYDIYNGSDVEASAYTTYSTQMKGTDPFESVTEFLGWIVDGFTFSGEYTIRGIPSYAYSIYKDNYYGASGQPVTLVLFYAKDDIDLQSIYGNTVPLVAKYIYFWNYDGTRYITQEHIFDSAELDYSRLTYDPLDISMCAEELEGTAEFGLILESSTGDIETLTPDEEFSVKDAVRMSLSAAVDIDELRILPEEVSLSGGDITVLGKVFGGYTGPTTTYFATMGVFPEDYFIPDDDVIDSTFVDSLSDCNEWANDNGEGDPVFVSYCTSSKMCTTYNVYHLNELDTTQADDCYYVTYGIRQTGPLPVDDTWDALVSAYTKGDLVQILDYSITSLVRTDPDPVEANDPAISDYSSVPGRVSGAVETYDNYDVLSCAQLCTESLTYECQQFTYCDKLKQCTLNPQDANPYIEADDDCYFYTRDYLSEFTAYPGTSGLSGTEMIYEEIEEPNDCAHLCLYLTDFLCESFEFCSLPGGGSGTCSLGNTHYSDVDHMTVIDDVSCTHYSRSYLGDYERFEGVTDLAITVEIDDSTPEECAKLCSEESESSEELCVMFQFCETNMACQLIDPKAVTSEALLRDPDVQASDGCATYSLLSATDLTHGRSSTSQATSASSGSNGGLYGAGSMAVIAIIMLVIGVALVFLSLWLYARKPHLLRYGWWRNRVFNTDKDEMTMTFSKAQDNS